MIVPLFPLLGFSSDLLLLDPTTVFTPLALGLVVVLSLCGLGIGVLIARADTARTARAATHRPTPPALTKAA